MLRKVSSMESKIFYAKVERLLYAYCRSIFLIFLNEVKSLKCGYFASIEEPFELRENYNSETFRTTKQKIA